MVPEHDEAVLVVRRVLRKKRLLQLHEFGPNRSKLAVSRLSRRVRVLDQVLVEGEGVRPETGECPALLRHQRIMSTGRSLDEVNGNGLNSMPEVGNLVRHVVLEVLLVHPEVQLAR